MNLPDDLKYTKDHEWLKLLGNDEALVRITDLPSKVLEHHLCGDSRRRHIRNGASFGVVESVKKASDLYMPVDAKIIEGNQALETLRSGQSVAL